MRCKLSPQQAPSTPASISGTGRRSQRRSQSRTAASTASTTASMSTTRRATSLASGCGSSFDSVGAVLWQSRSFEHSGKRSLRLLASSTRCA